MAEVTIPFDPKNFTGGPITNQFMPLTVGNNWVYQVVDKSTNQVTEKDTVTVTDQKITIDGVQCVVVSDVVENVNNAGMVTKVTETTNDYFAQDKKGDVWYFGEDTKAFLQPGGPSTEGTWRAGVSPPGAQPGVIMLAHPKVGDSYFEEQAPPVAVDRAAVTSLTASATVPFGSFGNCLQTLNTSATPGDIETKTYAPGIGSILEVDAETSQQLVSFNGQPMAAAQSGVSNLVQAMASFGDPQSGIAPGHATQHLDNSSLNHVLAAHSHQA